MHRSEMCGLVSLDYLWSWQLLDYTILHFFIWMFVLPLRAITFFILVIYPWIESHHSGGFTFDGVLNSSKWCFPKTPSISRLECRLLSDPWELWRLCQCPQKSETRPPCLQRRVGKQLQSSVEISEGDFFGGVFRRSSYKVTRSRCTIPFRIYRSNRLLLSNIKISST